MSIHRFADLTAAYTHRARCQLIGKLAPMLLRGILLRARFRGSTGLILVGRAVTVRNPQYVTVGSDFVIEDLAEVQGLSRSGLTFGDNVTIGRFAMIRPSGYYGREPGEGLWVGNDSNIGPYCYIGCSGFVRIGNNVLMGPRVSIIAENHNFARTDKPTKLQGVTRQEVDIGDDCWLGSNSVILAGIRVGEGAVVAAGAVVTKDVPPYAVVGGVPAKVIRSRLVSEAESPNSES